MLNNIGLPGLLMIVAVTVILFGRGKVSAIMGEMGSGITAFRKGIREGDKADALPIPDSAGEDGK